MLSQPFNNWTLKFHHQKMEDQFEEMQNGRRLQFFKILMLGITVLSIIMLIFFLVQKQPIHLIIIMAVSAVLTFSALLSNKIIKKQLKLMYTLSYGCVLVASCLIVSSGFEVPIYPYVFSISQALQIILTFGDNRFKLFYIIAVPIFQLVYFNLYSLQNFQWFFVVTFCSFLSGIKVHLTEYNSRSSFSNSLICQKQKQIINQFVTNHLFGICFDERSQQFLLEFANKSFENSFQVKDSQDLKGFLRKYTLNSYLKSQSKQKNQNIKSLEDFLFEFMKKENENSLFEKEDIIDCQAIDKTLKSEFRAKVQVIDFCQPVLLIFIEYQQIQSVHQQQQEVEQIKQQAMDSYSQSLKSLKIMHQTLINILITKQLQKIQTLDSLLIFTMNEIRSYYFYFTNGTLQYDSIYNSNPFNLYQYINLIGQHLQQLSQLQQKKFFITNKLNQCELIKTNAKILTQIIFCIFQTIIQSTTSRTINLIISKESNIDPHNECKSFSQFENINQLSLIEFTFQFLDSKEFSLDQKIENQTSNMKINLQVVKSLLKFVGPYNSINEEVQQKTGNSTLIINSISFYIYNDQSTIEVSYMNSILK